MLTRLRDYQEQGIADIRAHYKGGGRGPCYVLSTGGGKTVLFSAIAEGAARKGKSVAVLVHRDELVWQTSAELTRWGVDHGIIASGQPMLTRGVQVASVWTLVRRLDRFNHFDLIIIDEAHHAVAGSWRKVVEHMPYAKLLGVTATPARLDGKGLGKIFDGMVMGPPMETLIRRGFLANYDIFAPAKLPDLKGLRKQAGDYKKDELEARVNTKAIIGNAIDHYRKHLGGAPSIAFCVSIKHAEAVAQEFREAGFNAVSIDGQMSRQQQQNIIADLRAERLNVMTSCELISEGYDVPNCYGALLMRPTQSLVLFLQQCGRALRFQEGKRAVLLDHAGNSLRHGLPAAPRAWTLKDGVVKGSKAEEERKLTKTCKNCYAVFEIWRAACPKCGASHVKNPNGAMPDQLAGELLKRNGLDFGGQPVSTIPARFLIARAKTREQLEAVAKIKGYHRKWVDRMLAARGGAKAAYLTLSRNRLPTSS